ncbi:MAG: branched-chain amino acid ABC transporter permease [Acetobacteraceae bacterium]|nr:branched-chain amino acid ABC transporter permease [Acetobacteraceae bacterium]
MSGAALLEVAVGGIAIGCVYSLLALGYSMIIRASGIIHFAQGEVMMIGSMCGLSALWLAPALHPALVLLAGMAAGGVLAGAMELLVYRTLRRRRVPLMNIITATVGLSILLMNAARLGWGSEPLRYPDLFSGAVEIGQLRISPQLLWIAGTGFAIMIALQLFLSKTRPGLAMQAIAQDPDAAQLIGINLSRSMAGTFAVAGAMAGAAGVMLGSLFFSFFEMGFITGLKAFVAATLGGLGSIGGAMLGGILFGLIETFGAVFVSSAYKDAIGMLLLIAILLVLPQGLAGLRKRGR